LLRDFIYEKCRKKDRETEKKNDLITWKYHYDIYMQRVIAKNNHKAYIIPPSSHLLLFCSRFSECPWRNSYMYIFRVIYVWRDC
jgi:hypothetical protein